MKNQTTQNSKQQTPVIRVGTVGPSGAIVRQILRDGVLIGFEGSDKTTAITFKECETLFK